VDGSSTKAGNGVRLIIESHQGERHEYALKLIRKASNNKAEYEALIAGVELCHTSGADSIRVFSDSQIIVS